MKTKTVKKSEMWRKYKGTTAEELCAAIGELLVGEVAKLYSDAQRSSEPIN